MVYLFLTDLVFNEVFYADQSIHNGYFYIDIIEEQIRHSYNVKANRERVAQYKREITMLENWINANLQIDDASIL